MPVSTTGLATIAILALTGYWLASAGFFERLMNALTRDRLLTGAGFAGGLIWGPAAMKMAVGFLGGLGTLAIGDVIPITAEQFGLVAFVVIAGLLFVRGGE